MPDLTSSIDIKSSSGIGEIVLSNPEKYNALDQNAWLAIPDAIEELVANSARVIVLSGTGGNFCAGADISEFDQVRKNAETALLYEEANEKAFAAIRQAEVPTLAKIKGFCLGGGFGLAAAADLRLSDKSATFGVPAARLGLGYPADAMADIVAAVGAQNSKRLLFTAGRYSAEEMFRMGFISEVMETNTLDSRVADVAKTIANLAPLTHASTKASIAAALGGDREKAAETGNATFSSEDYTEGLAAFREKRPPHFTGK